VLAQRVHLEHFVAEAAALSFNQIGKELPMQLLPNDMLRVGDEQYCGSKTDLTGSPCGA
jgi:hypothetical protein